MCSCKNRIFYKDVEGMKAHFDLSECDKKHFLYDTTNKKEIWKFKDETHSIHITEFIGLRSKMYSIKNENV